MEIKAFKAYRFNSATAGDTGKCIAPPYDVINDLQQEELYQQSPYNIVRIDKGKIKISDNETQNQYTRAAEYLADWLKKGILTQESKDSLYAYVQNFDVAGKNYQRSGIIALGKLVEFGSGVQPHEKTLDGPKADRLKLTLATDAQFGQIFMLYDDSQKIADKIIDKTVAAGKAAVDFTDTDNIRHRLFIIDDARDIAAVVETMKTKEALIADGHHRYETALNYRKITKKPTADWQMMTFINMQNEGLIVLPTHRLVGDLKNFDIDAIIKKLQEDFKVTEFTYTNEKEKAKGLMFKRMKKAFEEGKNAFGIYDGAKFYFIVLKSHKHVEPLKISAASKSLDVVVLHKVILERLLGIGDAQLAGETNIEYIKDIGNAVDEAIAAVDKKEKQILFFMNPTKVEQVKAVAAENEKMPQKSTFFHPKIFTGLTINKL
ncbi:MAG TPA: DUF1015 domain-containing protein [Phycisphaerales bacterium]|nr:MAG: hypothetical protein A2Y13_10945 [Planctomycetes bacterium GWC2_45_44]HBG78217.1 DUF1015 domain-containing protein [Phycisphaerales bacterium]HBR18770.1 DUF1015 domain-containing protein [Phycisphaerales bacterium]